MYNVEQAVEVRYTRKACCAGSLSCGGAFDLAEVQPGESVVDIGSGRGVDIMRAAEISPDREHYGIDPVDAMLRVSRESAAKVGLANAQFLRGYAHEIPLETETADVVISNCVINHAPDKTAVFKEIRRVLKPDGRFVISDVVAEQDIPEPIRTDPDAVAACYGGAETKSKYFEALSRAGFHHIDILEESEPYRKGPVDVRSITVRGYKNGSGGLQPGR